MTRTILITLAMFVLISTAAVAPGERIALYNSTDVATLRTKLLFTIFGNQPPGQLTTIERNILDARLQPAGACSIDRITVLMEFGFRSTAYHLHACSPNKRLMIIHDGHIGASFTWQMPHIVTLLAAGYDVALFEMPLYAGNYQVVNVCPDGCLSVYTHNQMSFVRPTNGHALRFYLEPVIAFLNYAAPNYSRITMMGLSGGGWTTTWIPALDERIAASYPVAGSIPLFARRQRDWGDWEQYDPQIYRQVTYSELYIMATSNGRQQMQILNLYDDCCFATNGWNYAPAVQASATALGGRWSLLVDETHTDHNVSPWAMEKIMESLSGGAQVTALPLVISALVSPLAH